MVEGLSKEIKGMHVGFREPSNPFVIHDATDKDVREPSSFVPLCNTLAELGNDTSRTKRRALLIDWFVSNPAVEILSLELDDNEVLERLLASCKRTLTSLCLTSTEGLDLRLIGEATALESLTIYGDTIERIRTLSELTALRALRLMASWKEVLDIGGMALLEEADLSGAVTGFASARKLRELTLFARTSLTQLTGLPALEELSLFYPTKDSFAPLASLPGLRRLFLDKYCPSVAQLEPLLGRPCTINSAKYGDRSPEELHGLLTGAIKAKTQADYARPMIAITRAKIDPAGAVNHTFGVPVLLAGESWPRCGHCNRSMPCVLQLERPELGGILQLFYCTNTSPNCEIECEAWAKVGPSMLLRILPAFTPSNQAKRPDDLSDERAYALAFGAEKLDVPGEEDCEDLFGLRGGRQKTPAGGDKILGWPRWIQSPEWPRCSCGGRMELLVQLASSKAVAMQWGDLGYAYIFRCAEHDELAFLWQAG